jgi:hypothetical protein
MSDEVSAIDDSAAFDEALSCATSDRAPDRKLNSQSRNNS